jgi:hypothetical protein
MAIYQIKYTSGVNTITIQPGSVNGSASTNPVTDLDLYGQGTLNWGAGVDQNQLRLLECWACPQAVGSTLRPVNKDDMGVSGYSGDGVSTGINHPTVGQLWYNLTDGKLYICKNSSGSGTWDTAGADPDLFLPLTGGLLTGVVDQVGVTPRYGLLDSGGIKGKLELVQDPTVVDPTVIPAYPADTGYPDTPNQVVYPSNTDHLVLSKENVNSSQWINQLRIQDDGIVIRKNTGGRVGNGTIRVDTPVTTIHTESTLTTKKWVADEKAELENRVVRKDVTSTQTMTGALDIVEGAPRLRLRSTGDTSDVNLEFYDNTTNLKGVLYLDQQSGSIDHLTLAKRVGSVERTRVTLEDDKVFITGQTPINGTTIWTSGTEQGKIHTPSTTSGDSQYTLTTKDYVEGNYVSLTSQTTDMDGIYKFGVPNNDITIERASFKSITGAFNFYTSIDGPTFESQNGSTNDSTTIFGASIVSKKGGTNTSTMDGERLNQVNGVNTSQLDASGLTFTTTNATTRNTVIQDGNVTFQASTGNDTVINGPYFRSTDSVDGQTVIEGGVGTMTNSLKIGPDVTNGRDYTHIVGSTLQQYDDPSGIQSRYAELQPGLLKLGSTNSGAFIHAIVPGGTLSGDGGMLFYTGGASTIYDTITGHTKGGGVEWMSANGATGDGGGDTLRLTKYTNNIQKTALTIAERGVHISGEGGTNNVNNTNNHFGVKMWTKGFSEPGTVGYQFWEGDVNSSTITNESKGGMFYDAGNNTVTIKGEASAGTSEADTNRTQMNLTRDNGIQTNKRFDFAANIWTQQEAPRIENADDRNQRGISAGGDPDDARARTGDIWIAAAGGSPSVPPSDPFNQVQGAVYTNHAYIAIGNKWLLITSGS